MPSTSAAQRHYSPGSTGGYSLFAPSGTVITSFSGLFGTIWSSQAGQLTPFATVYENGNLSGKASYVIAGPLDNGTWSDPVRRGWTSLQGGHVGRVVDVYIQCWSSTTCSPGQYADSRLRVGSVELTFDDQVSPSVGQSTGNLFTSGWRRGRQLLGFSATDAGGGVHSMSAALSTGTTFTSAAGCQEVGGFFAAATPCPLNRFNEWSIDTAAHIPDGAHTVTFKAEDVGGRAATGAPRAFKVDNHAPGAPLSQTLTRGSGWRSANGFDLAWSNPVQQHAPIAAAHWRICPAGRTTGCTSGRAGSVSEARGLMAPAPGEWDARIWLEDEAGNGGATEPANSGAPVRLRWDPQPPALAFRAPDPNRPAIAAVDVRDMSGLTGGTIEIARIGGGSWQTLHTTRHGNMLEAEIPDERLAAGEYRLRAHAVDGAGNEGSTEGATRALPIRFATHIRAGALARVQVRRRGCGRRGRPRCRTREVTKASAKIAYGRTARIAGSVATTAGTRLQGRPVEVVFSPAYGRARRLAAVRTSGTGALRFSFKAMRSGVLSFRFPGDRRILPAQRNVRLSVPAPVSIGTRDRFLFNGEAAVFGGRIRGGSIPAGGKLIEIQAYFRRKWRTISTTRSDRGGRWRFAYTFGGTTGKVVYRFRARVPAESGYPFASGASKAAKVTVRGL